MVYRDAKLHELDLLWMHYFDALKLSSIAKFENCENVIDAAFKRGQELAAQLNKLDADSAIQICQLEDRIQDLELALDEERDKSRHLDAGLPPGWIRIEMADGEYERMRKALGPKWEWLSEVSLTVHGESDE